MKGTARCGWDEGAGETFIDYQNSARLFPDQEVGPPHFRSFRSPSTPAFVSADWSHVELHSDSHLVKQ